METNNKKTGAFTPRRVVCAEQFPSLQHQDTQQCVHVQQEVKHAIDIRKIFQCLVEMLSTLKRFPDLTNIKKQQC